MPNERIEAQDERGNQGSKELDVGDEGGWRKAGP